MFCSARFRLPRVVIGGILALPLFILTRQPPPEKRLSAPFGRYTAQQILDRTRPLCRLLAPTMNTLHLIVEHSKEGSARLSWWSVSCTDQAGSELLYFVWNASTGELCMVDCSELPASMAAIHGGTPLGKEEAAAAAWQWIRNLGISFSASHWRLVGEPQRSGENWMIYLQADRCRAEVQLGVRTRNLVRAECFPR